MTIKAHKSEVEWIFIDKEKLNNFCDMIFPPDMTVIDRRIEIFCNKDGEFTDIIKLYEEYISTNLEQSSSLSGLSLGKVFSVTLAVPGVGVINIRREKQ